MDKLVRQLDELESKISQSDSLNLAISKSSIGWHIEHALLTINLIIEGLKQSDPNDYKWKFSRSKFLVFTMNKIPRGRARSPKAVLPKGDFSIDTLRRHCNATKIKLVELQNLKPKSYIQHPFFGKLKLKSTLKFIVIHTKHHIDIINDILKANNR